MTVTEERGFVTVTAEERLLTHMSSYHDIRSSSKQHMHLTNLELVGQGKGLSNCSYLIAIEPLYIYE